MQRGSMKRLTLSNKVRGSHAALTKLLRSRKTEAAAIAQAKKLLILRVLHRAERLLESRDNRYPSILNRLGSLNELVGRGREIGFLLRCSEIKFHL